MRKRVDMDTQQIELVGRAALESRLIREGFEVARPTRDKGIDLIVFLDEPSLPFAALSIQMKSYRGTRFGVWRKYEGMTDLVHVYVWNVLDAPRFFLMNWAEAAALVPEQRKRTPSWNREDSKAGWSWKNPPRDVASELVRYENRWAWLRERLQASRTGKSNRPPQAKGTK